MSTILQRGLIVSCQAEGDSPFNSPELIAAFAKAAEMGGAVAVRVCGQENVCAVRRKVRFPIIGITKSTYPDGEVLITGTLEDVTALTEAGADFIALDATARIRSNGLDGIAMVREARRRSTLPLIADVSTFDEGIEATAAGADFAGTTLSGYTSYTAPRNNGLPDQELIEKLARQLPHRVIAEGRIWTPEQAAEAIRRGAHAVVVGTAITRPVEIVKRFVRAL